MRKSFRCLPFLLLVLSISLPAWPACLNDLPGRVLLFANPGDTVVLAQSQDGDFVPLGRIRLSCKLSVEEWKTLPLSKKLCTGATIKKSDGGQCRIIEAVADKKPLDPGKFDSVIVRKIAQ